MTVREINIGSIGGIHYEMYDPDPRNLDTRQILEHFDGKPDFLNLNGLFWSELLSGENIERIITDFLESGMGTADSEPYEQMIRSAPELFKNTVQEAKVQLCEQGLSEREYFGYLETLAIVCRIYSRLYFGAFELTVHEGFLLESYSSLEMLNDCLIPAKNPYYWFLKKHVWKELLDFHPDCVWINGRMTVANMAIAKFLKGRIAGVKIFWAMPGSEYYAANKIEEYLQYNIPLFSVIDGIVLDDFENTRAHIIQVLEQGSELGEVNNLMYSVEDAEGNVKIHCGHYEKYAETSPAAIEISGREKRTGYDYEIAPWQVVNVKLYPQRMCSWNKCTFCGINKKYRVVGEEGELEDKIKRIEELQKSGCKYFWFVDEEIPAERMKKFARAVLAGHMQIRWQVRARIAKGFADRDLCKLLFDAGLREIRFGLESASYRILKLMNKVDEDFSLELVEQIVRLFHDEGISVHFPVIIGFPGETDMEREQTYQFLRYLKNKYESFTFNVNVLGLDVSSLLFKNWQHYGITKVSFPCNPHYFLGNLVSWDCDEVPFQEERLKMERDNFMREILYPWLPEDALISPHIFYRLMETVRNTLIVKDRGEERGEENGEDVRMKWNPSVIICSKLCYNMKEHQKIIASVDMMKVRQVFEEPVTMEEAVRCLKGFLVGQTVEDLQDLIQQMLNHGIIKMYYNLVK